MIQHKARLPDARRVPANRTMIENQLMVAEEVLNDLIWHIQNNRTEGKIQIDEANFMMERIVMLQKILETLPPYVVHDLEDYIQYRDDQSNPTNVA